MVHKGNSSSPVAMAVKEATNSTAIHNAWKGLVGFWQLHMAFKAANNAETPELQALLVLRPCILSWAEQGCHVDFGKSICQGS